MRNALALFLVAAVAMVAQVAPAQTIDPTIPEPVLVDESVLATRVDDLTEMVNSHTEALAQLAANDEALEARLAALEAARAVQAPQITYKAAQLRTSLLAPSTAPKAVAAQPMAPQGQPAAPAGVVQSITYGPPRVVAVGPPVVTYSEPIRYTPPLTFYEELAPTPTRYTTPVTTTRTYQRSRGGLFGGGGLFSRRAMVCGPDGCY
jgi:hypothetical protein